MLLHPYFAFGYSAFRWVDERRVLPLRLGSAKGCR